MKIIEALKSVKELQVKADDLRKKIAAHSAHVTIETPVYPDQNTPREASCILALR